MTVGIRSKRRPAPRRGPSDSDDYNASQDEMITDLTTMVEEVNAQESELDRTHLTRFHETIALRAQMDRVIAERRIRNLFDAAAGDPITTVVDFRGFTGPDFEVLYTGLDQARRARVEPLYGQVLLPYNNVVNRVYGLDPDTGDVVIPSSIEVSVTGYDQGGTPTAGTPKYAVNGNDQTYWIRKVRLPLESDVDYVEAELQVNLPALYTTYVNMLSVHPFPLGQIDIEEITYSSTSADPSIALSGFSQVNCAGFRRWHFQDVHMTKVKIKIRQRHFVEEKGFKVFYLGLQELLLHLVDFDRTANPVSGPMGPTDGNGVIVRVDAPEGYTFQYITRFLCDPDYAIPAVDNKIFYRIYSDAGLVTEQWSSWADNAPQVTPVDLTALGLSSIYVALTMEWDDTNSVSPLVNNFALRYTVA